MFDQTSITISLLKEKIEKMEKMGRFGRWYYDLTNPFHHGMMLNIYKQQLTSLEKL